MENNSKADLIISMVLVAAAIILATRQFIIGNTVDGILWLVIVVAVFIKEVRKYLKHE